MSEQAVCHVQQYFDISGVETSDSAAGILVN
jgi:hypothetical protein